MSGCMAAEERYPVLVTETWRKLTSHGGPGSSDEVAVVAMEQNDGVEFVSSGWSVGSMKALSSSSMKS